MDPLTHLYRQLCAQQSQAPIPGMIDPPRLEEWLRFWNDDDTDLGNLKNFEHWLREADRNGRPP
jgi:hypothetical protein